MTNQPQLGRAAGANRFPNDSNPLLGFKAPTATPGPYTQTSPGTGTGAAPGLGGAKADAEGYPKPGNRSATQAVPGEDTVPDDRAGARLAVTTNSTAQRSRYLRQYLENQPASYDPLQPRESLARVVPPYQGDKLWAKRRQQRQQGR
jgi:hypothetical protein